MRKYLKDIGVEHDNLPENWYEDESDKRKKLWAKQRKKYGFDERETWNLDSTLYMFLYERLMMYNKVNILDTTYHKKMHRGVEINFQEAIDRMICLLRNLIISEKNNLSDEQEQGIVEELFELLSKWSRHLWW